LGRKPRSLAFGSMIGPAGRSREGLLEDLHRLAHLEDADHVAVVGVAVRAERHAEVEAGVESVAVHLAEVVVDAAGAEDGAGDAGVDGLGSGRGTPTPWVRASMISLPVSMRLVLVEEAREVVHELARAAASQLGRRVARGSRRSAGSCTSCGSR